MTDVQNIEPLLQPDENRYVMFPIQYNDIWEMYKRSIDSFGTLEKFLSHKI